MKFDIVRAWKDESYRQSLNAELQEMLPVHPAGDLSDAELASVCGSDDGGLGSLGNSGSAAANAFAANRNIHWHSLSVAACETNTFSAAQTVAPATPLLSPTTVICAQTS